MKLKVILFNQHWFHLCAAAEAIVSERHRFEEVEIIFSRQGLKLWPLDLHFIDYAFEFQSCSPEQKLFKFLDDYLSNSNIKVTFSYLDVKKEDVNGQRSGLRALVSTFEQLRKLNVAQQPVGMAISSYLISKTKSSNPSVKRFSNTIQNAYYTYFQIQNALLTRNLDYQSVEIWICNGRQLHERSVVEFCKTKKISQHCYLI